MLSFVITISQESQRYQIFKNNMKSFEHSIIPYTAVSLDDPELMNLYQAGKNNSCLTEQRRISRRLSLRNILLKAKEMGEPNVLVFEDDAYIYHNNPTEYFNSIVTEFPEEFGVCYLGCYFKKTSNPSLKCYSDHLLELDNSVKKPFLIWGSHAVIYNHSIYDIMMKNLTINNALIIDKQSCVNIIPFYKSFCSREFLFFQSKECLGLNSVNGAFNFDKLEKESLEFLKNHLLF